MGVQRIQRLIVAVSVALAPLTFTSAVGAQATAPPSTGGTVGSRPVGEVVVTGKLGRPPKGFSTDVSDFVASHSQPSPIGLLSRWMTPVCPTVVGLSPRFTDFVTKRITEVAVRVGAPHRGRCRRSNVRVVFTAQPQKLMDHVRDKFPDLLGFHYPREEKALATFQGPIDSWHVTGTRDASGGGYADSTNSDRNPQIAFGGHPTMSGANASRLRGSASSEFLFALVVIDPGRVPKQPIGKVADQIAMLVLTNPKRPRSCSPLPTLMDALDSACPASASVASLTPYDESFLTGLYASDAEESAALQQGTVARRIEKGRPADLGQSE